MIEALYKGFNELGEIEKQMNLQKILAKKF
jgi:hypothetical protein